MTARSLRIPPANPCRRTQRKTASPTKLALLVMAGLPTTANDFTKPPTQRGEIIQFLWKMKTDNYSEETMEGYGRALETLAKRGADLNNPQSVKETIATQKWSNGTKQNATNAVRLYCKYSGITAIMPTYKRIDTIPFIPTESEIDQLISATKHQLATFLQVLKETAARYGEAFNLKWTDYNTEQSTLSITPEKGSNPRAPKISTKLQTMLAMLPHTNDKISHIRTKTRHAKTSKTREDE
jgi:integrase